MLRICGNGYYIMFAKANISYGLPYIILCSDISLFLAPPLSLCYNTPKAVICMKRMLAILLIVIMIFGASGCSDISVRGSVVRESTYGNAELDIMPQKLLEKIQIGDTAVVAIGGFSEEMPFVDELIEEDGTLQLFYDKEGHNINICIYNQRFCEAYGIEAGDKVAIKNKQ